MNIVFVACCLVLAAYYHCICIWLTMHLMLVYIVFSALAELKIKLPQYAYATCQETDQPLDGLAIAGM